MEIINLNKEIPDLFYNKINNNLLKKNSDNIDTIHNFINKTLNINNKKYDTVLISNIFYDYLYINFIIEYNIIFFT